MNRCRKCGRPLGTMIGEALLVAMGARIHPSPTVCPADGAEHVVEVVPSCPVA